MGDPRRNELKSSHSGQKQSTRASRDRSTRAEDAVDDEDRTWGGAMTQTGGSGRHTYSSNDSPSKERYQKKRKMLESGRMVTLNIKGYKGGLDQHEVQYTVLRHDAKQPPLEGLIPERLIQKSPAVLYQGHCRWTSPLMAALDSSTCVVVGLTALPGATDGLLTSHVCLMEPVSPSDHQYTYVLIGEESTCFCAMYERLLRVLCRDRQDLRGFKGFLLMEKNLKLPALDSETSPTSADPAKIDYSAETHRRPPREEGRGSERGDKDAYRGRDTRASPSRHEARRRLPSPHSSHDRDRDRDRGRDGDEGAEKRYDRRSPPRSPARHANGHDRDRRDSDTYREPGAGKSGILCRHGPICRHQRQGSCRFLHEEDKADLTRLYGSDRSLMGRVQKALRNHPWKYGSQDEYTAETSRNPATAELDWARHAAAYVAGRFTEWDRCAYWDRINTTKKERGRSRDRETSRDRARDRSRSRDRGSGGRERERSYARHSPSPRASLSRCQRSPPRDHCGASASMTRGSGRREDSGSREHASRRSPYDRAPRASEDRARGRDTGVSQGERDGRRSDYRRAETSPSRLPRSAGSSKYSPDAKFSPDRDFSPARTSGYHGRPHQDPLPPQQPPQHSPSLQYQAPLAVPPMPTMLSTPTTLPSSAVQPPTATSGPATTPLAAPAAGVSVIELFGPEFQNQLVQLGMMAFMQQQMGGAGPLGPRPLMHPMGMPGAMPPGVAPMYPYPFPPHMAPTHTVPPPQGYVTPGAGNAVSDPRYGYPTNNTAEPSKTDEEDQQLEKYLAKLQQHRR